mgnify:CR=1 FL=1
MKKILALVLSIIVAFVALIALSTLVVFINLEVGAIVYFILAFIAYQAGVFLYNYLKKKYKF